MKKLVSFFVAIAAAFSLSASAGAYIIDDDFDSYGDLTPEELLTDNAGILTESEEEKILKKLEKVSEKYDTNVMIYTTRDVPYDSEGACMDFAFDRIEEYLAANGEDSGIIFCVDMNYRLWNMSTKGETQYAITEDYGLVLFDDKLVGDLSDGDYEECFLEYISLCEEFLKAYENGEGYTSSNKYVTAGLVAKYILIAAVIGLVVTIGVMVSLKKQLKSVEKQKTANNFVRRGSFKLVTSQDLFLYKNVTKTRRQSSSSGGGRSGGGGSRGGSRGGRF